MLWKEPADMNSLYTYLFETLKKHLILLDLHVSSYHSVYLPLLAHCLFLEPVKFQSLQSQNK